MMGTSGGLDGSLPALLRPMISATWKALAVVSQLPALFGSLERYMLQLACEIKRFSRQKVLVIRRGEAS